MSRGRKVQIHPQPDDTTCGPTCLHAVLSYYGADIPLGELIGSTPVLEQGGTLAVLLGTQALLRGYRATIYTFNLHVFDPTWFDSDTGLLRFRLDATGDHSLAELELRLREQVEFKQDNKLSVATQGYIEYLRLGGELRLRDLNEELLRSYLDRSIPVLTGLSSTYLYNHRREYGIKSIPDDIRGQASGHFVVLCDFDSVRQTVSVADPYLPHPFGDEHYYEVSLDRLVCSIMLGVMTYDANLLIVEPKPSSSADPSAELRS